MLTLDPGPPGASQAGSGPRPWAEPRRSAHRPPVCCQVSRPVGIQPASAFYHVTQSWPACLVGRPAVSGAWPPAATLRIVPVPSLLCLLRELCLPHAGRTQLFLAHGKLCKGGYPGAPGVQAQVCLARTHAHLQSIGSGGTGLGPRAGRGTLLPQLVPV